MKQFLIVLIAICLSVNSFATCDFSTGITKTEQGYLYTKECHIKVGETVRDLGIAEGQNKKLIEALSLKDFALSKANERADLWMNTSYKLEARIETMDGLYERNKWLYFGIGVLATSAAVYAAGQLSSK